MGTWASGCGGCSPRSGRSVEVGQGFPEAAGSMLDILMLRDTPGQPRSWELEHPLFEKGVKT